MDRLHLNQHISRQFNSEIEDVRRQVLAMGGLVEEQIAAAMHVLVGRDAAAGTAIRERERQINAAELAIDERCAFILARRQPAASDLRLVLAVIKMLADLERIGDEAKRIAKRAEKLVGEEEGGEVTAGLGDLGVQARGMLRGALDAFARFDEHLALDVLRRDRRIDATFRDVSDSLVARMQRQPDRIPVELDRLWCARSLERIGDRCKNLCEFVLYLVRGKDVRHSGLAKGDAPSP
ncbi:phosphate signaling complex protein PhoU [Dokdonella sp.]|uniref:phosphate signaling complex protein PhoU n=1 Tax=Dokdonella sp. TaxID=2291710 RepID=UPI00261D47E6|nr:phosphate signaling complex protein PhoU [Dokdonella sp.]